MSQDLRIELALRKLWSGTTDKVRREGLAVLAELGKEALPIILPELAKCTDPYRSPYRIVKELLVEVLVEIGEPAMDYFDRFIGDLWHCGGKEVLSSIPGAQAEIHGLLLPDQAPSPGQTGSEARPAPEPLAAQIEVALTKKPRVIKDDLLFLGRLLQVVQAPVPQNVMGRIYELFRRVAEIDNDGGVADLDMPQTASEFLIECAREALFRSGGPEMALRIVTDPDIPSPARNQVLYNFFDPSRSDRDYPDIPEEMAKPLIAALTDEAVRSLYSRPSCYSLDCLYYALGITGNPEAIPFLSRIVRGGGEKAELALRGLWQTKKAKRAALLELTVEHFLENPSNTWQYRLILNRVCGRLTRRAWEKQLDQPLPPETWVEIVKTVGQQNALDSEFFRDEKVSTKLKRIDELLRILEYFDRNFEEIYRKKAKRRSMPNIIYYVFEALGFLFNCRLGDAEKKYLIKKVRDIFNSPDFRINTRLSASSLIKELDLNAFLAGLDHPEPALRSAVLYNVFSGATFAGRISELSPVGLFKTMLQQQPLPQDEIQEAINGLRRALNMLVSEEIEADYRRGESGERDVIEGIGQICFMLSNAKFLHGYINLETQAKALFDEAYAILVLIAERGEGASQDLARGYLAGLPERT